jgi:hypothetical protein
MDEKKVHRLMDLKDEVKEFHPFLRTLFPKMPGIQSTEYTHGTTEYGADFVLERTDQSLGVISGLIPEKWTVEKCSSAQVKGAEGNEEKSVQ